MSPIVYCVILYASRATVGNLLNFVFSALNHSLTLLKFLRKLTWIRIESHLVYQTLALPKRQVSRVWRILQASLLVTMS